MIDGRERAGVSILQWALVGLAVLLVLGVIFLFSRAAIGDMRGSGMMFFSYSPLGFGIFGAFWIILIFALPVFLLWPANRRVAGNYLQEHDSAILILRERYAKGEIGKEQFDQMTRDLMPKGQ